MNDAQIAIYSVDLRSTTSRTSEDENTFTHPYDIGDPQFDTAAQAQWKEGDTTSTLQLFAENTRGKAFLGGNNLVQTFRQATQDDSSYYMLGYYVSRSSTKAGMASGVGDDQQKRCTRALSERFLSSKGHVHNFRSAGRALGTNLSA